MQFLPIFLILISTTAIPAEKILALSFFSSQSHKNVYEPLLQELAKRGHSLTVVSPYKGSSPHPNIKEIIPITEEEMKKKYPEFNFDPFAMRIKGQKFNPSVLFPLFNKICRFNYEHEEIQKLLNQKFDLVFASIFMNECSYGILAKLQAPFIFISPHAGFPTSTSITGSPSSPSFVPMPFFASSDKMNFLERARNFLVNVAYEIMFDYMYVPQMEALYREYLGNETPSIRDIMLNTSLIFINSHLSINYPKPLMPDVIEVGGMHCREAKPLPKDLDDFLKDTDRNGFILFSLGSVVKAHEMPGEYRRMFVNAFSRLRMKVLWKWESNVTMDDLPKNVMTSKWLPQQDILGHKNIKAFFTHGGLLSTEESIYNGVPLVGMPIFADQDWNIATAVSKGFAYPLELHGLTEEKIVDAINTVVQMPKYRTKAQELSKLFKDRPQKPLETAIYWSEYVMRNKGAHHLRSPARYMGTIQYHSIDVVVFLIGFFSLVLYVLAKMIQNTLSCICYRRRSKKSKRE